MNWKAISRIAIVLTLAGAAILLTGSGCRDRAAGTLAAQEVAGRDTSWAQPVAAVHLENLYLVDEGFYRCEQPSKEGFTELWDMDVREVLNLRNHHSDEKKAGHTQLLLHRVKMNAGTSDTDQFVEALRIIHNRKGPIAIHCWHGSDRTGIVCALYRMVFQGWDNQRALDELMYGGYGYHPYYKNIKTYVLQTDADSLRRVVLGPESGF